jgi:hypothetical protein
MDYQKRSTPCACRARWGGPRRAWPALASSRTGDAFISFKGIDPALEASVTDLEKSLV